MTQSQLAKIWVSLGLFLLYYSLNSWIVTQGGQEIFGAKLVLSTRVPAALIAIPLCSVVMMAWAIVGTFYARRDGQTWYYRIPVAFFDSIDTGSAEGRIYQAANFGLVLILPLCALAHFWDIVLSAPLLSTGPAPHAVGLWDWNALGNWDNPARLCGALEGDGTKCVDGCTILPAVEPGLFALLSAGAVVLSLRNLWAILHPEKRTISEAESDELPE